MEYGSVSSVLVAGAIDDNTTLSWGITAHAICGAPAATHITRTISDQVNDSNSPKDETVLCPNGTHVHGVGVRLIGGTGDLVVDDLTGGGALLSVKAKAFENDSTANNWAVRPQAICAS